MTSIKCIGCEKLLAKVITDNVYISYSSDLIVASNNGFLYDSAIELKCNTCKSFMSIFSIFSGEGDMDWLKKLMILYQQKQVIHNGD